MLPRPFIQRTTPPTAGLAFLLIGLGLTACLWLSPTESPSQATGGAIADPTWVESGQVSLPVNPGDSPLSIAQHGFEEWLSQYNQAITPLEASLDDFRVDHIEAVSDPFFAGEYDFVFRIEYSVRPAPAGVNRWLAGDGREGQAGWIVEKLHYVGVRVINDTATIYILGPCPMC